MKTAIDDRKFFFEICRFDSQFSGRLKTNL